jgi:hypothetical protein
MTFFFFSTREGMNLTIGMREQAFFCKKDYGIAGPKQM